MSKYKAMLIAIIFISLWVLRFIMLKNDAGLNSAATLI